MLLRDPTRKKLYFRATHRGTREMDILLGKYVSHLLHDRQFPQARLDDVAQLLDVPDQELMAMVRQQSVPKHRQNIALLRDFLAHHTLYPPPPS